jgi:hypothetical protein
MSSGRVASSSVSTSIPALGWAVPRPGGNGAIGDDLATNVISEPVSSQHARERTSDVPG